LFEGKTYDELKDTSEYQKWLEKEGKGFFPEGENPETFKERTCRGFEDVIHRTIRNKIKTSAFIGHGGTIMSILEKYAQDDLDFFHWHTKNGGGYKLLIEEELWLRRKKISGIEKL
jgi:alpha-ribazole phosphatase